MKTTQRGHQAEEAVSKQMKNLGYEILSQNWRTPLCEIDIVARKDKIIYFVEVKFRLQSAQGDGLEHITKHKLSQMKFAGRVWNQHNNWDGDWRLVVVSVTTDGQEYLLSDFVELE